MLYEKEARLNVPGTGAQGVVVDATETVLGFPVYVMRWLDEAGETHTGTVGEGDLRRANQTDRDRMLAADASARRQDEIAAEIERGVNNRLQAIRRQRKAKPKASKRKR